MSRDRFSSAWVEELSDGEVGEELSKRGLPLEGDPPSRKARLSRWEYYRSLGMEPPRSPISADIHEFLDPIEDMRPDSPSVLGTGLTATPGATTQGTQYSQNDVILTSKLRHSRKSQYDDFWLQNLTIC